jgi:hypothetical protein
VPGSDLGSDPELAPGLGPLAWGPLPYIAVVSHRVAPFPESPSDRTPQRLHPKTLAAAELIGLAATSQSTRSSPGALLQGEESASAFCCRRRVPHHLNGFARVRTAAIFRTAVLGTVASAPVPVPPSQLASPHRQLRPGAFRAVHQAPQLDLACRQRGAPPCPSAGALHLFWVAVGCPSLDLWL